MIYKTPRLELLDISTTHYFFNPFDIEDRERFLKSGEWKGKAGACMVEGFCKRYIREVRGFESTTMGLCVEILKPFLSNETPSKQSSEGCASRYGAKACL